MTNQPLEKSFRIKLLLGYALVIVASFVMGMFTVQSEGASIVPPAAAVVILLGSCLAL